MKKFWIQVVILLVVIFGALAYSYNSNTQNIFFPAAPRISATQIKVGDSIMSVEVADTPQKRAVGLGGREGLATDSGMLFVFTDQQKHQFWMKGMKFPLDFIFISNGKAVDIIKNVPIPLSNEADSSLPIYEPVVPVDMMLEVNAGFADAHNIKVGDPVMLVKSG